MRFFFRVEYDLNTFGENCNNVDSCFYKNGISYQPISLLEGHFEQRARMSHGHIPTLKISSLPSLMDSYVAYTEPSNVGNGGGGQIAPLRG